MLIEERDASGMHAKSFPDAVAEDEARIEHGNDRFVARLQFAVDVDQNVAIAWIVDKFMCALCHGNRPSLAEAWMVAACVA